MKLLVLGGTVFLSKAVAEEAVRRGHDVTCACRGESGSIPDGAQHLVWDRDQPAPAELSDATYDAVVDVARHPSRVRSAVAAVPDAHWVFVSTISVYAENSVPGGSPGVTPEHEPITEDVDLSENMEAYGPMKVACEQAVLSGAASAMVIRPGLIIGPGDPSGRFTYWPLRVRDAGDGGEVLAPGAPDDTVQVIDVRDLASWIVDAAEARTTGTVDGIGPVQRFADLLDDVATGVGADTDVHLGGPGLPHRAGCRRLGRPGLAAAVAAETRVRRHAGARRRAAARGGTGHAPGLRERPGHRGLGRRHP